MAITVLNQLPQGGSLFPQTGSFRPYDPIADAADRPDAYRTGQSVGVRYSPQANGLTAPVDTVVVGPTRVLESSQRLLEGWRTAAGVSETGSPTFGGFNSNPNTLTQVENDVVRINHPSREPLAYLQGDHLHGDPHITSPFVTSNQVHQTVTSELGRDIKYRSTDGRLNVNVGMATGELSPFHSPNTGTLTFPAAGRDGSSLANDPDVVSHEQGHAILNSQRPDIDFTTASKTTHEAFADGVSFFNSLKDSQVRADTIRRWDDPSQSQSGLAANLAEAAPRYFGENPSGDNTGLRDLSAGAPGGIASENSTHREGMRFGSALHDSTRQTYLDLRRAHPELSAEQAFERATGSLRSDFYRSLDFLPPGGTVTQDDLAAAMMRANSIDGQGDRRELYQRSFEGAGLRPVNADRIAQEAGTRALSNQITLPENLRGGNYEAKFDAADSPVRRQASQFLEQNGAKLGIPASYQMQPSRVYSNERGETFMLFDGTDPNNPNAAQEMLSVGFDRNGGLIQFDSAQGARPTAPSFNFPPASTPCPPTGTGSGGGFPFPLPRFPNIGSFPGGTGFPTPGTGNQSTPPPIFGGTGTDQVPHGH